MSSSEWSSSPLPPAASAPPRPSPPPHAAAEIAAAFARPLRIVDLVLAAPERIAANLEQRIALGSLTAVFLVAASVFAIPYGCVLGWDSWWRILALYLGSTVICLPSLYVFGTYLGVRASLGQIAILALSIPAVASLFTFGFAPILGFLRLTMGTGGATEVSWRGMSNGLLSLAALAGFAQLWRCLIAWMRYELQLLFVLVLLSWHIVFVYVLLRMARVLEIGQ